LGPSELVGQQLEVKGLDLLIVSHVPVLGETNELREHSAGCGVQSVSFDLGRPRVGEDKRAGRIFGDVEALVVLEGRNHIEGECSARKLDSNRMVLNPRLTRRESLFYLSFQAPESGAGSVLFSLVHYRKYVHVVDRVDSCASGIRARDKRKFYPFYALESFAKFNVLAVGFLAI
jgi:hypothetical protein